MDFEAKYAAFFDLLENAVGAQVKTASRRLKHWSDVPPKEQPCIFVTETGIDAIGRVGLPQKYVLGCSIYIYVYESSPKAIPATKLNNILKVITETIALRPSDISGCVTLGGLVTDCKISGKIETDEGLLDSQAVAIVPIQLTVA